MGHMDQDTLVRRLLEYRGKAFGYIRISSTKQEQGLSLQAQERVIKEYCRTHELSEEPFLVTEIASSKTPLFSVPLLAGDQVEEADPERKQLRLLLGHLMGCEGAHLVVWRLDRLARLASEREMLYQLFQRQKITLHSTDAGEQQVLKEGDPSTTFMRQILAAFSQYEKQIIQLRMDTGMAMKAAMGKYTGGVCPFGYKVVDKDLVIDPDEAQLVQWIFAARHLRGASLRDISREISRAGMQFTHTKVGRILNSEATYRGKYTDRYGTVHQRDDLVILHGPNYEYRSDQHGIQRADGEGPGRHSGGHRAVVHRHDADRPELGGSWDGHQEVGRERVEAAVLRRLGSVDRPTGG